jgi:hypothetical protein
VGATPAGWPVAVVLAGGEPWQPASSRPAATGASQGRKVKMDIKREG